MGEVAIYQNVRYPHIHSETGSTKKRRLEKFFFRRSADRASERPSYQHLADYVDLPAIVMTYDDMPVLCEAVPRLERMIKYSHADHLKQWRS